MIASTRLPRIIIAAMISEMAVHPTFGRGGFSIMRLSRLMTCNSNASCAKVPRGAGSPLIFCCGPWPLPGLWRRPQSLAIHSSCRPRHLNFASLRTVYGDAFCGSPPFRRTVSSQRRHGDEADCHHKRQPEQGSDRELNAAHESLLRSVHQAIEADCQPIRQRVGQYRILQLKPDRTGALILIRGRARVC